MKQEEILQQVKDGRLSIEEASSLLKGIEDIGYAAIDLSRQKRNGFPEIIYGEGKNIEKKQLSLLRHSEITSNVFTTSELRGFTASSIVSKTSKALAS